MRLPLIVDLVLDSLVGGEQAEGGLVGVFLHHLGHNKLLDSPRVESQVVCSLFHCSINHLLHCILKQLIIMAVLLPFVPQDSVSQSSDTLTSHPSVCSRHLKNFLAPSVLMHIMMKPWVSSSLGLFPLMPETQ